MVELTEIVEFLKNPGKYSALGAKIPRGAVMEGPPGTGKTLLARVMAAQAEVPFFYCSGSDFVELFVGRGAARMRALFKEAAAAAPSLVFVDELDALGKQRSLRLSGSNDEVEQTLNQMLACMDGGTPLPTASRRPWLLSTPLMVSGLSWSLVCSRVPQSTRRTTASS